MEQQKQAAAAEIDPKQAEVDEKAAKRAAIMAKVAAATAEREKQETQKANFFGEHPGISCDGCGAAPLVGYRYHCSKCANHDVCESCFDLWGNGKGEIDNQLGGQKLSIDPADHSFKVYRDKSFKSLVKGVKQEPVVKKTKPNEPCPCGSGKKYKKCCGK
eukprot:CAMPEP_0114359174 /NCGR_PEP_ID=MMETSP0101-20121206/22818_1 /TAXON_ID=38822 ORGANISM="Pteridomonas danica, Strain PT" /NCGR_SAMPLE_ID=MMETSP0101 /ASSEMBLY_ACC=CAM_ASM_000211 /LENGTH=159 /DNA_ID=CAMNT_0001502583 /DNA_START=12 /DNA_END=491 /DNA_ORIENTATION=+